MSDDRSTDELERDFAEAMEQTVDSLRWSLDEICEDPSGTMWHRLEVTYNSREVLVVWARIKHVALRAGGAAMRQLLAIRGCVDPPSNNPFRSFR